MHMPNRQRGLSAISLIFLLGFIALVSVIVIKTVPLYLNQMKVTRSIHGVADDSELANVDASVIHEHLVSRWTIESIDSLSPKDVKIKRTDSGRELIYDYEARAELFYNISIVVHFADDVPMRKVIGSN